MYNEWKKGNKLQYKKCNSAISKYTNNDQHYVNQNADES